MRCKSLFLLAGCGDMDCDPAVLLPARVSVGFVPVMSAIVGAFAAVPDVSRIIDPFKKLFPVLRGVGIFKSVPGGRCHGFLLSHSGIFILL